MTISQIDLERGRLAQKNTDAAVKVTLSNVSNVSAALDPGLYIITAADDCFFMQGPSNVTAAAATGRVLHGRSYRELYVSNSLDTYVAGIVATGTGTLSIERIV